MISAGEAGRRSGTEAPLLRQLWAGSSDKSEARAQPPSLLGQLRGSACITAVALQLFLCSSYIIICASKYILKWTPDGTETTLWEMGNSAVFIAATSSIKQRHGSLCVALLKLWLSFWWSLYIAAFWTPFPQDPKLIHNFLPDSTKSTFQGRTEARAVQRLSMVSWLAASSQSLWADICLLSAGKLQLT